MKKIQIEDDLIQYQFKPKEGRYFGIKRPFMDFGINIIVLIDEDRGMMVDTGFKEESRRVFADLNDNGLALEKAIITHFHGDHIFGLRALPETIEVYGSHHYQRSLDRWIKKEQHKYYRPAVLIREAQQITFGRHQITLTPLKGHSESGLLIDINGRYLCVGDEMIFSNDGAPVLPLAACGVQEQIRSLEILRSFSSHTLIPAHGSLISGSNKIEEDIRNRLLYLEALLESGNSISFAEAVKRSNHTFLQREFHTKYNINNRMAKKE